MHNYFKNNNEMFGGFYSQYFCMYDYMRKHKRMNSLYKYLYGKLFMLSIRALIYELHIYKQNDKLTGLTSQERYTDFERITETSEFERYFKKKYPILCNRMNDQVSYCSNYANEICTNFMADSQSLKQILNSKMLEIKDIIIGEGDTHNGGKSVAIVETNSGRIVYKPHSLASDYIFEKLLCWINSKGIKCELKSLKHINNVKYGWQEYIEYNGYLSIAQGMDYYYKCGSFLALFYILGTTDIHFENIIVNKDNPYFIDLETLFSVPKYINFSSVLETNFIPGLQNNVVYDFDISGLCGKGNVSSKIKTISVVYPKTDEMRIENINCTIKENKNNVYVEEESVNIEDYENIILTGFTDLIDLITRNKNEFLVLIEKIACNDNYYYRQVIRATQVYSKFLLAATHPMYLQHKSLIDELFSKLLSNVNDQAHITRIHEEIQQLKRGDVPYFMIKFNSNDLFTNEGIVYSNYFNLTIKDGITSRVGRLNDSAKNIQLSIIKKSLFTAYNKQYYEAKLESTKINNKNYSTTIAKIINDNIFEDSTGTLLFINTLVDDKFFISNINLDLYEGGGIIWFLACFGKVYQNDKYLNKALKLFESSEICRNAKCKIDKENRLSIFSGVGSCIYLSFNLYKLTGKDEYYERFNNYCVEAINLNDTCVIDKKSNTNYDYLCGISGIIVAACKILKLQKNSNLELLLCELEINLVDYLNNQVELEIGIAHGASGIAYTLYMLQKVFPNKNYHDLCIKILTEEIDKFIELDNKVYSWCKGTIGMIYIRALAYSLWQDKSIKNQIDRLFTYMNLNSIYISNNCLCHGWRGIKEVYYITKEILDKHDITMTIQNIEECDEIANYGLNHNMQIENFMMGTSGVAYSHLRDTYKELPSILALDIYDPGGVE